MLEYVWNDDIRVYDVYIREITSITVYRDV